MDSGIGWLLDVTVERNAATLWIKATKGGIPRLTDKYQPCFYILPRTRKVSNSYITYLSNPRVPGYSILFAGCWMFGWDVAL